MAIRTASDHQQGEGELSTEKGGRGPEKLPRDQSDDGPQYQGGGPAGGGMPEQHRGHVTQPEERASLS